jgi:hypothetical protein
MNDRARAAKWNAIARATLFWFGFFFCLFAVRLIAGLLGLSQSAANDTRGQWFGGASMTVLMLILTWGFTGTERYPIVVPGTVFVQGSIPRALAGVLCILPFSAASVVSLHWLVPGVRFVPTGISVSQVFFTIGIYLLLAAYEEIAFRGYPMRRLLCAFGVWPTLLLIAPVFALYHVVLGWGLLQALIGTGAGSIVFGMAAIASHRGLAFPIGVHAGWNLITWSLGIGGVGIWKMSFPETMSGRVQVSGMVSYLTFMFLATMSLWFWKRRNKASEAD